MTTETALAIVDNEAERLRALCAGDLPVLEHLLSDELIYTHSNGLVDDKATFLDRLRQGIVQFENGELLEGAVRQYGDIAVFHGRFKLTVRTAERVTHLNGRQQAVWKRTAKGNWQQLATASTPVFTH